MSLPDGDLPDSLVDELLIRAIGDPAPADAAPARRAAEALLGRPDALELLHEVVVEEGMLDALLERMHADDARKRASHRVGQRRSDRAPLGRYWQEQRSTAFPRGMLNAAALLLVVGGVAIGFELYRGRQRTQRAALPEPRTVVTHPGQRATIELPDGSRAILAPNTALRYVIAPRDGTRDVQLDGEAYFDVRHDRSRPFRVHTRQAVIEDLGTTFVVREYASDSNARVAVRSGAVALRATMADDTSIVAVHPGEVAELDSGRTVVRVASDSASNWVWTTGRLAFDETPLPVVLAELHDWYDVDFRLTDSALATQYFTGAFTAASLPQVLDILGPLVHARFERQGRVVVVTRRPGRR